ncbi:hypothetical protein E2P81_ATG03075 [Venturia nashicola]|uniref:Uncharacterized protein n=1 Tax=Venturia nashicola TaxID=86259 RepID=A0A4Z1P5X0_9PEZI|nr:hypothetical protein E6O75_ATG03141 [Venturia nashicola]TLD36186.1 hypothetical protein E2P81_ATG03075 [Venturia nashicola]
MVVVPSIPQSYQKNHTIRFCLGIFLFGRDSAYLWHVSSLTFLLILSLYVSVSERHAMAMWNTTDEEMFRLRGVTRTVGREKLIDANMGPDFCYNGVAPHHGPGTRSEGKFNPKVGYWVTPVEWM